MGVTVRCGARPPAVARATRGQMTVELMVALPVMIAVALVAVSALSFMGTCASFDHQACEAVRVCATAPQAGWGPEQCAAEAAALLDRQFGDALTSVTVECQVASFGHLRFLMTLRVEPSLFGRPLSDNVFGVSFPPLAHTTELTVDSYKPGVIV